MTTNTRIKLIRQVTLTIAVIVLFPVQTTRP